MPSSTSIRKFHRVVAGIFMVTVFANFAWRAIATPPGWINYIPLPPLFLLMATGLSMLALPAALRLRAKRKLA